MALTPSTMLPLGTPAPDFTLPDTVTGSAITLSTYAAGKAVLIQFLCAHCPYVKHIEPELTRLANDYAGKGVAFLAIGSNDAAAYPDDAPAKLAHQARTFGWDYPYLYDETQAVARAYKAACTPDFFLFDREHKLAYRGRLDGSRPRVEKPEPLTGADLRAALDSVLAGKAPAAEQLPSLGCNIKWRE
ncbi:Peroxiredoxin [Verrucomicrobium sp. GAS474]|uniref:thioredoxin family protein n=1 Tax=Verrucomicrobium sp. GAS474 TaxID=1882831 RepID=UPI00087DE6F8|nr:thioredoxin family protein [Verrucomicrobium sp. GAS474]SDT87512.1 Peroxiredoxin [Verrucomicrobium sp. GAS474]